jgi:phospholipid/cholesterol/gamma-HCH transport system permease protein
MYGKSRRYFNVNVLRWFIRYISMFHGGSSGKGFLFGGKLWRLTEVKCMNGCVGFLNRAGAGTLEKLGLIYGGIGLGYDAVAGLLIRSGRRHISLRQIVNQILFTGVDALVIVGLIALSCGVTIAVQATTNMPQIGASQYFGMIMVIAVIRELGPFFTSIVVIGRSGAALAAYIGNMRVTKEIAALEVMGINLSHFLVMPAFLGMLISLVCLNIYFDIFAILGGLLVAKLFVNVQFLALVREVLHALSLVDIVVSLIKCVLFGAVIAIVSCYQGLSVTSIRIVPRAVFRAVVGSIVVTIITNVILTVSFYAFTNTVR